MPIVTLAIVAIFVGGSLLALVLVLRFCRWLVTFTGSAESMGHIPQVGTKIIRLGPNQAPELNQLQNDKTSTDKAP